MVPAWSLLAALAAGLILGALGSRLFVRRPEPLPAQPASPSPPPAAAEPTAAAVEQAETVPPPEPEAAPSPEESGLEPEPPPDAQPSPPPPPASLPEEAVRISMEDVVSELERRYQGRQADAAAEKRPSTRRRRSR